MDELDSLQGSSVEGFLPTQAQRRRLLKVVEDHIGLAKIVDEVVVDSLPWERSDRTSGARTIKNVSAELMPVKDDLGPGAFEFRHPGAPLSRLTRSNRKRPERCACSGHGWETVRRP